MSSSSNAGCHLVKRGAHIQQWQKLYADFCSLNEEIRYDFPPFSSCTKLHHACVINCWGYILPRLASIITTLNSSADKEKAVGCSESRIMQSNKNMWLLFAVSPSAILDLSQAYAISSSPLAGELKGTNDSWSTDGAAQWMWENMI